MAKIIIFTAQLVYRLDVFLCVAGIELMVLLLVKYLIYTLEVTFLLKRLVVVVLKLKSNYLKLIMIVSTVVIYGATPLNLAGDYRVHNIILEYIVSL